MVMVMKKKKNNSKKIIHHDQNTTTYTTSSITSSTGKNNMNNINMTMMMMKKKYKGVRMRSWGSWVSEIRAPNQKTRIWLGSYSTAEAAARAYDAALICLKGTSANLNFPLSSYNYNQFITNTNDQLPIILSPKSIQRVAAEAAAATSTTINSSYPSNSSSSISSSSSSSSSNMTSSEEEISLVSCSNSNSNSNSNNLEDYSINVDETSWYNTFDDSPEYNHDMMMMMINGTSVLIDDHIQYHSSSSSTMMVNYEDVYEDGDIRLWSFC